MDYVDKIEKNGTIYPVRDTVSGYIDKDVQNLKNYAPTNVVEGMLAEKADVSDVPAHGSIQSGNTGYITGGEVYNIIGDINSSN